MLLSLFDCDLFLSLVSQFWVRNWLFRRFAAYWLRNPWFSCITYCFIGAFFSSVSWSRAVSTKLASHTSLSLLGSLIRFLAFLSSDPNSSSSSSSPHLYPRLFLVSGPLLTLFIRSILLDLANRFLWVDLITSLFFVLGGTLIFSNSFLAPLLAFDEVTFSSKLIVICLFRKGSSMSLVYSWISFGWYFWSTLSIRWSYWSLSVWSTISSNPLLTLLTPVWIFLFGALWLSMTSAWLIQL